MTELEHLQKRGTAAALTDPMRAYPRHRDGIPTHVTTEGRYVCRFARNADDLERAQRLRYAVFNIELGEGLDTAHATQMDVDEFDPFCHHLLVEDQRQRAVVGTYRLQTAAMAAAGRGFYADREFALEDLPAPVRAASVEIGRACIERSHRGTTALLLLWRAVSHYVVYNGMRYVFGCCSVSTQDATEAARVHRHLAERSFMHPTLAVAPRPDFDCREWQCSDAGWEAVALPRLFRTYLRYGARICGRPALDREFKTVDFLALIDLTELDPATILKQLALDGPARPRQDAPDDRP